MPFPDSERVIYRKNPLIKVICQLRFPPILKIEKEIPSEFQEQIRNEFPNFNEKRESYGESLPYEIRNFIGNQETKNYEFISEDNKWRVNLTRTFLALSTSNYNKWDEFWKKMENPLNTLIKIYNPSYYTRIGLRYIDEINRKKLGNGKLEWKDLLKSWILGLLSTNVNSIKENITEQKSIYRIRLKKSSNAKIITRYYKDRKNGKDIFKIDSDFYCNQKVKIGEEKVRLDYFNKQAGRLIRWIITEKLRELMIPQKP